LIDPKLDELVQKLKAAAGANLKSIILYGSAATEEFHAKHSDLNLLCIVEQADASHLEALHAAAEWWVRRDHRAPLVFTLEELKRSADIVAIELLDMKARHRLLHGENVMTELQVPMHLHAIQVERELRANWLRLRQSILAVPRKPKVYLELMTASFSSFAALFRHALIALGEPPAGTRSETIDRIAQFAAADPGGFKTVLALREGKLKEREIDVEGTMNQYLGFVETVTDRFDRQMEGKR
jgi:hypothetical protein